MSISYEPLRIEARRFNFISGIYCFIHIETGRMYIGSSNNVGFRIRNHIWCSEKGRITTLYKAIRQFGTAAFSIELIESCKEEFLIEREFFWILFFDSVANGFNVQKNPQRFGAGFEQTIETKDKIRKAVTAMWNDDSARAERTRNIKNAYASDATLISKSSNRSKKLWSDPFFREHRAKVMKPIFESAEYKEKLRQANFVRYSNPEERAKSRKAATDSWNDPSIRAKRTEGVRRHYLNVTEAQRLAKGAAISATKKKRNLERIQRKNLEQKSLFDQQGLTLADIRALDFSKKTKEPLQ